MRLDERIRRQLLSETGMDFGRLRPSAGSLRSADGGAIGAGLVRDLFISLSTGFGAALVMVLVTVWTGVSGPGAFVAIFGSVLAGLGVASLTSGRRLRRRIPEEVDSVFRVAGELARESSTQLERVSGSAEQIVRGLVMVSALPAVAAAVSRRFVVLAPVIRPLLEGLLGRIVDRGMPAVMATVPDTAPRVREIAVSVTATRDRVIGRVSTLVRWGTLPVRVLGTAGALLGVLLATIAWVIELG